MREALASALRRLAIRLDPEPEVRAAMAQARQSRALRKARARLRELEDAAAVRSVMKRKALH
jgi:hypothetical protein